MTAVDMCGLVWALGAVPSWLGRLLLGGGVVASAVVTGLLLRPADRGEVKK